MVGINILQSHHIFSNGFPVENLFLADIDRFQKLISGFNKIPCHVHLINLIAITFIDLNGNHQSLDFVIIIDFRFPHFGPDITMIMVKAGNFMRIKFQFFLVQDTGLGNPGKKPFRTGFHDVPEFITIIGFVPFELDLQDVDLVMFLDIVFQQNLVVGKGFGGLLYFGIVVTLFLVKISQTINTLPDGIKIQNGIQINPKLFLKIFIINLVIPHKHDLAYGRFFYHIEGNHLARRTGGHVHGDILEKTHFVDITKILVQFIKVQPIPRLRAHNGQNGSLFDSPIACHMN